jgi:hypothetical protein
LEAFIAGWLIPLMGNIIPISFMHLVINIFVEKGWEGVMRVILAMLLYLRGEIVERREESELMNLLSTISLRNAGIRWEEVIKSSFNIRNLPILYK